MSRMCSTASNPVAVIDRFHVTSEGHIGVPKQYVFYPPGIELYFYAKTVVLFGTPDMAALSRE